MENKQIQKTIDQAIKDLKNEESPLDFSSIHERSTSHRLAVQMERYFSDWNVDCEYNRNQDLKKELIGISECDPQRKSDDIFPDIIVHHRGLEGTNNNLLVIEMKKDSAEDTCDKKKLELFTSQDGKYQYQLGLYLNINNGEFTCSWYKDGKKWY